MAYDAARGQVVLFGGLTFLSGAFTSLGDTWVWDGSKWTQKFPQTSPPARQGHGMVYDSVRHQVVLFGGITAQGTANDTWLWDGTNWASPSVSPPPARTLQNMAFDSARGQVLMFGGQTASFGQLSDTWVWTGANWVQQNPANVPVERSNAQMAFDSAHSQVVLFGGDENDQNDTWLWDGSHWTQASPQTIPPGRSDGVMAFDPPLGKIVLFGGVAAADFADTWTWDGTNWAQLSPAAHPSARHSSAMAYDSTHNQMVFFGGIDPSFYYGDTWFFQVGPPGPSITTVISASAYGGSPTVTSGGWVEIYGANLASNSRGWGATDFKENTAPTSLDGVQVSIGGQFAAVAYISPTQVNAQLPSNLTAGANQIEVINATGTSNVLNVTVNLNQPGLLAPASFQVGGKQYLVALLSDNATYVLPAGAISGIASRPAHPGETIVLYGVGFGTVVPFLAGGQVSTAADQLSSNFQIMFGGVAAQVTYDGLAPGFVGLYQFNVVVPQVADNNLVPVTYSLAGVPGTQTLYTAVKQ